MKFVSALFGAVLALMLLSASPATAAPMTHDTIVSVSPALEVAPSLPAAQTVALQHAETQAGAQAIVANRDAELRPANVDQRATVHRQHRLRRAFVVHLHVRGADPHRHRLSNASVV